MPWSAPARWVPSWSSASVVAAPWMWPSWLPCSPIRVCAAGLKDIYGVGNARGPRLPLIQVPTTAGTGSEVTQIAIITTGETTKMGVVSPVLLPDLAVLDAELTLGLPPAVTAATGIDAMVHAIEAYTSKIKKNPLSDLLAREALRLLAANLHEAVYNGRNREARQAMLLGALSGRPGFCQRTVCGCARAGLSAGRSFPYSPWPVQRPGAAACAALQRVGRRAAVCRAGAAAAGRALQGRGDGTALCRVHRRTGGSSTNAAVCPVACVMPACPRPCCRQLARDAMLQQRLLVNNPREVSEADALAIYQAAY